MRDRRYGRIRAALVIMTALVVDLVTTDSAPAQWVVLAGQNGHAARGIPDEAFKKLGELARQGATLRSLTFAPNGGWVILTNKNGFFARGIPDEAFNKIKEFSANGAEIRTIGFTPTGGWVILGDRNQYFARGIPDEAFQKLGDYAKQGAELRSIAFAPNGGWVILVNRNGYLARNVPQEAADRLDEYANKGAVIRSITFAPGGGWVILVNKNGYLARNVSEEAAQTLGKFASRQLELNSVSFLPGPSIRLSSDDTEARKQVLARMAATKVPGLSIALIKDGRVEWARGYGVLRAGSQEPVTPKTRFQAASVSKPVAALAALRLVQKGTLKLDAPLNTQLKSWKVPDNNFTSSTPPTLRQALSHSAGFTVHGFGGYRAGAKVPKLRQVLDGAPPANSSPIRVEFPPGSKEQYSGGGYTVMQQLIVDTTGAPFPQALRTLVLDPLKMKDSTYEQPLPKAFSSMAATGHVDGSPIAGFYHTYPEMAAAGLWTTPSDLARFVLALQQAHRGAQSPILSKALAAEMMHRQKGTVGLGVFLSGSGASTWFSHNGVNVGFECGFTGSVNGREGAVVMTNATGGSALVGEILQALRAEYHWSSP